MALTKRIRIVRPEDEEASTEPPAESPSEAPQTDDDDREEEFTEEGDPVDRRMTVPKVVEICNQLEMGVNSLVHFGISFRFRKDRHKRLDKIIKQIEGIRIAVQFDEFMAIKTSIVPRPALDGKGAAKETKRPTRQRKTG